MHKSSYQHMQRLVSTHLAPGSTLKVVDIGAYDVNGSYRTLFTEPGWQYTGFPSPPARWTWWCPARPSSTSNTSG